MRRAVFAGRKGLFLIFIWRFDSDEQLVPFVVSTGLGWAATRKGPVQNVDIRHQFLLRPSPGGQFSAAGTTHLIAEELDKTFVNAVVVWFNNALAVFVTKPKQAFAQSPPRSVG